MCCVAPFTFCTGLVGEKEGFVGFFVYVFVCFHSRGVGRERDDNKGGRSGLSGGRWNGLETTGL